MSSNSHSPKPPPAPPPAPPGDGGGENNSNTSNSSGRTLAPFPLSNRLIASNSSTPPKQKKVVESSKRRLLRASLSAQSFKAAFGSGDSSKGSRSGGDDSNSGADNQSNSSSASGSGNTSALARSPLQPAAIVSMDPPSPLSSQAFPVPIPNPLSKLASPGLRPVHSGASTYSVGSAPGSPSNSSPVSIARSSSSTRLVATSASSSKGIPPVPAIPSDLTEPSRPIPYAFSPSNSSVTSLASPGIDAGLAISQNVSLNNSGSTTGTCSPNVHAISADVLVSSISAFGISNSPPPNNMFKYNSNESKDDYVVGKFDEETSVGDVEEADVDLLNEQDEDIEREREQESEREGKENENINDNNNDNDDVNDNNNDNNEGIKDSSTSVSSSVSSKPEMPSLKEKLSLDSMTNSFDFKRTDNLNQLWDVLEPTIKNSMKDLKNLQTEVIIQWISSNSAEWVLGSAIITSEGSLELREKETKDIPQNHLFISDLRKTTVVGTPHKRYMELIIPPTVSTVTRIILSTSSENDFIQLLSTLLLFSSLKPSGLQQKVWVVPRDDLPSRIHGPGKEVLMVGHFEIFFPYFKNKIRRSSGAANFASKPTKALEKSSAFSKDGMWQPVVGILEKSGILKLMHESDGALIQTIDLTKILASRIRQIDSSVFECRRVVYVYCKDGIIDTNLEPPNKSRESHLFFCRFENSTDYFDWFTAIRSFCLHRLFSLSLPKQRILESSESTTSIGSNLSTGSIITHDLNKVMRICRQINLRIIEGKVKDINDKSNFDLSPFHDTYVEVQFENIVWARTFVCHGNSQPFWREDFVLNDFPVIGPTLKLVLKRRLAAAVNPGLDIAIGSIILDEDTMRQCQDVEKWFPLVYTPEAQREYDFDLYLCLKISYDETKVLTAEKYSRINDLLCDVNNNLTTQISEATGDINRLSEIFLKIMLTNCQALKWLISLIDHEILKLHETLKIQEETDENFHEFRRNVGNTLFRGNSLLTKALERYMKLTGTDYLDKIVGVFTRKVVQNGVFLEIDPDRLSQFKYSPQQLEKIINENQQKLTQYTKYLWNLIKNSVNDMPIVFKIIFKRLRVQLSTKLKRDEDHLVYNSVAGFLFLRFFCPALLNPKLFGLTRSHPTGNVQRSLTLITKMLQGFANRVRFGFKEPWMIPMNSFIDEHEGELFEFYKSVTVGEDEDDTEYCLCKNKNDGSLQSAIGCTLSNPYLIDRYENIARLIEVWNENEKKDKSIIADLPPEEDNVTTSTTTTTTTTTSATASTSTPNDTQILNEFIDQAKLITADKEEVYNLLQQAEVINESNKEEIVNSIELKFDQPTGKVTLAKTRIAFTNTNSSTTLNNIKTSPKKIRYKGQTTSIDIPSSDTEAQSSRASRWIRLASGKGRK